MSFIGVLGLKRSCSNYSYLEDSGCVAVKTINDVEDFRHTEVRIFLKTIRLYSF